MRPLVAPQRDLCRSAVQITSLFYKRPTRTRMVLANRGENIIDESEPIGKTDRIFFIFGRSQPNASQFRLWNRKNLNFTIWSRSHDFSPRTLLNRIEIINWKGTEPNPKMDRTRPRDFTHFLFTNKIKPINLSQLGPTNLYSTFDVEIRPNRVMRFFHLAQLSYFGQPKIPDWIDSTLNRYGGTDPFLVPFGVLEMHAPNRIDFAKIRPERLEPKSITPLFATFVHLSSIFNHLFAKIPIGS